MIKPIKLLVESLFDDFDDTEDIIDNSTLDDYVKAEKLTDCNSKDEILYYFKEKFDVYNKLQNILNECTKILNKKHNIYKDDIDKIAKQNDVVYSYYAEKLFEISTINIYIDKLNFVIKTIDGIPANITYRNKSIQDTIKCLCIYKAFNLKSDRTIAYWYVFDDTFKNQKKQDIIDQQFNLRPDKYEELDNVINDTISYTYNVDRLTEELTCKPKVYKVTQKDIDRMSKCISTDNYTGFDLIKQPDKMAARLSALFIVAHKSGNKDMTLVVNDDVLLSLFATGKSTYSTTRNVSYREKHRSSGINYTTKHRKISDENSYYMTVLRKIRSFPTIHLKDIIATYNAYVNKF